MKVRLLIFARLSISSLSAGERLAKPTFAAMVIKQLKMRDRTRPYRTRKHRACTLRQKIMLGAEAFLMTPGYSAR
jgi:hypothetical protein